MTSLTLETCLLALLCTIQREEAHLTALITRESVAVTKSSGIILKILVINYYTIEFFHLVFIVIIEIKLNKNFPFSKIVLIIVLQLVILDHNLKVRVICCGQY